MPNPNDKAAAPSVTDVLLQPAQPATPPAPPIPAPDAGIPQMQPGESESRYQKRIDQLVAARKAAEERSRLLEERLSQVEQQAAPQRQGIPSGAPGSAPQMVGNMTRDQWDEWHDEDPVAAYQFIADMQAEKKAQQIMQNMSVANAFESTVTNVYKEHPELKEVMDGKKSPDEVPFWNIYDEVAREMPEARYMPRGAYIVMKEAERRMKEQDASVRERQIADTAAQQEADRQTRTSGSFTQGAGARPPVTTGKLTPDEERIARKMGMSPEDYAKAKVVKR